MTPELTTFVEEMTGPKCATTQKDGARICKRCGDPLPQEFRKGTRYCSRHCQNHSARDIENELLREVKAVAKTIAYTHLNRDRSLGFDGRYEGPLNKSVTFVVTIEKDKGYHPMPIDVHVVGPEPKFNNVTPDDVDWSERQSSQHMRSLSMGAHTLPSRPMPRESSNFCTQCVEMVIDKDDRKVRVTKGVYLPIEHQCNSVRVYNLRGRLLEIKSL